MTVKSVIQLDNKMHFKKNVSCFQKVTNLNADPLGAFCSVLFSTLIVLCELFFSSQIHGAPFIRDPQLLIAVN